MSTTRNRRYPGLHYFTAEQKDLFFGREAEKRDLLALVLTEKIVALFSKSGYGKSSLLRAGLAPELPAGWQPVIVQFGAYQSGQSPTPLARTLAQLDAAQPDDAPEMDFLETVCLEDSLWKRFKKKQNTEKRTFLLIFDQFEEFQTYPAEQREAFKKQLAELLFTRIPQSVRDRADELPDVQQDMLARPNEVKALFAIREDRLGVLDGLADKLPAILHKRYHLQGLDDAQATAAITLPAALPQGERFESPAFRYAPAAVESIKKGLKKDERDPHIESFLLQICCEAIEQKVIGRAGDVEVTVADLPVFKDLFEQYYRGKISALPDEARRNAARRMIEDQLVKTDPASGIAYRINADGRALCALPGVDEALLKQLTDFFLLRSEPNTTGGFSYEVSHDRLVEGILAMKQEWEAEEATRQLAAEAERIERAKADAERRAKEAEAQFEREAKLRRKAQVAQRRATFATIVIIGLAIWAFWQKRKAEELTRLSEDQKLEIEQNLRALTQKEGELQLSLADARAAKDTAEVRQKEAEFARMQAEKAKSELAISLKVAQDAKDTAQARQIVAESAKLQTNEALDKAEKLVNAFYFYADRFALAYGYGEKNYTKEFYFIDKTGKELKDLGRWEKAEQFDWWRWGFAKVQKDDDVQNYYLDTLGNFYPVAFDIANLDTGITVLDLSGQELQTLPEVIFENKQLRFLLLRRATQLESLPAEIGNLQNLQLLDLSNNRLKSLPDAIGELQDLQSLNLDMNELSSLPAEIGKLQNLQSLDLGGNKLSKLPVDIGNLQNMKSLNLEGNELSDLPHEFFNLYKLQSLDLSRNELSNLPAEIGKLQNLQSLNLENNRLNSLHAEIGKLQNLKSLNLGCLGNVYNKLNSLPYEIFNLYNLQSLDLSGHKLRELPVEIGKLQNLKSLNLVGNELSGLPDEIFNLYNLQSLDLSENKLRKLPVEIRKLQNLELLNLEGNALNILPLEALKQMPKLKKLVLHNTVRGNPIKDEDIKTLHDAMPWCEIVCCMYIPTD